MSKLSFKKQFDKEVKAVFKQANKAVVKVTKSARRVAINATPYRTGRARNGWKINKGRNIGLIPAVGKVGGSYQRKPGDVNFTFDIAKDKEIQLYNNVPYISFLENGQGRGYRKPHKMLYKASRHFDLRLQREFDRIK